MGNTCCIQLNQRHDTIIGSFIGSIKDLEYEPCIKELKTAAYLETKTTEKPLYRPIVAIKGDFDQDIEVPISETVAVEQSGLIVASLALIRGPTNFKIEPVHFRKECTKESFITRYSEGEIIGSGSFGIVKKIQDLETKLYRAVKIISKTNCQHTDNFADEIEIIKKLVLYLIK